MTVPQKRMEQELQQRLADLMQAKPLRVTPSRGGYTEAHRQIVHFENGASVFVKAATSELTASWLRKEYAVYRHFNTLGVDFAPHMIAWEDDGLHPILVLEDLSAAHWPPPWEPALVDRACDMLARVHGAPTMPDMIRLEDLRHELMEWNKIAADPAPFLTLGLCQADWLERALPVLMAAEAAAPLSGGDFVHLDVRSDNLCFAPDGRTMLVDWNWACVGNGLFDLAAWLPSLHAEGGPAPYSMLPDQPEFAAALTGFWAKGAIRGEAGTRRQNLRLSQFQIALPWAAKMLGLPQP